jgi:hypothetical protein
MRATPLHALMITFFYDDNDDGWCAPPTLKNVKKHLALPNSSIRRTCINERK